MVSFVWSDTLFGYVYLLVIIFLSDVDCCYLILEMHIDDVYGVAFVLSLFEINLEKELQGFLMVIRLFCFRILYMCNTYIRNTELCISFWYIHLCLHMILILYKRHKPFDRIGFSVHVSRLAYGWYGYGFDYSKYMRLACGVELMEKFMFIEENSYSSMLWLLLYFI